MLQKQGISAGLMDNFIGSGADFLLYHNMAGDDSSSVMWKGKDGMDKEIISYANCIYKDLS